MHHRRKYTEVAVVLALAIAIAILPSCKRAPEEPPPPATELVEAEPTPVPLTIVDLPQTNPEIGITLSGAPPGLVAIYSGEHWIELADRANPSLLYTLMSGPEHASGVAVSDIDEFESAVAARIDGRFLRRGSIETALGTAYWVSGEYSEDGELIQQVMVSVQHPSGGGQLTISSICPVSVASLEDRLEVIRQLLTHVS
jgi:hypothetical protein